MSVAGRESEPWIADPPRLTELGAKWVEVKNGGQRLPKGENESVFENVASNTRWSIARMSLNGLP